jgi:hypothetical protein
MSQDASALLSFYAMAREMSSLLAGLELTTHQQQGQHHGAHRVITSLRKQCSTRSPWFMTCLVNYLALLSHSSSSSSSSADFRHCLLSEDLSSIICCSDNKSSTNDIGEEKEKLLSVLDSLDTLIAPRSEHFTVTPLRLDLLLRIEVPDSTLPAVQAKFLFPNLLKRTILCVHALKSKTTICLDPKTQMLLSVQPSEECRAVVERPGQRGVFPPVVMELWCWYMDQFLREGGGEGAAMREAVSQQKQQHQQLRGEEQKQQQQQEEQQEEQSPLDALLCYISVCLDLLAGGGACHSSVETQQQRVWSLALLYCHPPRLQRMMTSLLGKGGLQTQRRRYTVCIILRSVDLLLNIPADTPGALCPTLTLCALCNLALFVAKNIFCTRVSAARDALNKRLALTWPSVANGTGRLSRPPLASSLFCSVLDSCSIDTKARPRASFMLDLMGLVVCPPSHLSSPAASACRVTLEVSRNKSPSQGETVSIGCSALPVQSGPHLPSHSLSHPWPSSWGAELVVLPEFSWLWRSLVAAPLGLSGAAYPPAAVSSSSSAAAAEEGGVVDSLEEVAGVLRLHERVYLPLLFDSKRYLPLCVSVSLSVSISLLLSFCTIVGDVVRILAIYIADTV